MTEPRSSRLVMLYLPMDLGDFAKIVGTISEIWPDARLGEPDEEGQVLVLRSASDEAEPADTTSHLSTESSFTNEEGS